jgi:transcriptional regulator with XRE-family HTH domain
VVVNYHPRDVAPQLPAAFWQTEPMAAALASGDPGQILRAYRFHPFHGQQPLPQDVVADWLHIRQSRLSRIEQGKRRVTIDDLAGFARDLGIPMAVRWLPPDAAPAGEDVDPYGPLEMVRYVERSELGPDTLEALHARVEKLCCDYSAMPPQALRQEAEQQLRCACRLLDGRKRFSEHRELLVVAGWLALLLGCLHNDMGNRGPAEAARDGAHRLGDEAGHPVIVRWACELHCWFALNDGRFHDITRFADAGLASLRTADSASVQLALQAAKGWAKLGDGREAEAALEYGSSLLDQLPAVEHPENHFVFDPAKYEFYAAPIYEWLGEHDRAEEHCNEVFERCTAPDGTTAWPMRLSDTQNTMALVQLHRGDLDGAIEYGNRALGYDRKCVPSLLGGTGDVVAALERRHPLEPAVHTFRERFVEVCREYGYRAPTAA